MKKLLFFLTVLATCSTISFAQDFTVTGQVTDERNEPVSYATISIKNGKGGVQADVNGNFKIQVKPGDVLQITAIGTNSREVPMVSGNTVYNVSLQKTNAELQTVVVSALGIKRSVKSTPYAVQQISAERLTQTRETDLTTALTGKIAGLQTLGQSGSKLGSNGIVRLRGVSGFADRGAIFVVDGTIVTDVTDINMDDVANVSVLKGPNATALYGQRAEGGVIMITTRKAGKRKALSIDVNSTTTVERVNILPEYQNLFGGGNSSNPNNAWAEDAYTWKSGHPDEWKALNSIRRQQYFDDASWGPRFDGADYIPWYAWYGNHERSFKPAKWEAQPDNIRDFFSTGLTTNNNISLAKGGDWWTARLSYTNLAKTGVIPTSKQTKHYVSTQNAVDFGKHFTLATNVGLTFEKFKGDFYDEYGNNTIGSFSQWFHRNLDMKIMKELRGLKGPSGTFATWNMNDVNGMSPDAIRQAVFWLNPYTWLDQQSNQTDRFRVMGDASLTYKLNNDFRITGTYRLNYRTTQTEVKLPLVLEQGTTGGTYDEQGGTLFNKYRKDDTKYRENNFELIAQYNKKVKDFTIELIAGGNVLDIKRDDSARATSGGLVIPDLYELSNSKSALIFDPLRTLLNYRQVRSAFFRGTVGYNDFFFIDFSGRNDWSSTLPINNNSYFYPSIGASFIFSDFIKNTALSYGKFRVSAAQIGTDPLNPYQTQFRFITENTPFGSDYLTPVPLTFIDPNIKAPLNTSYEAGVDLRFLKNRIGLSLTGYYERKVNEIVQTDVSSTSGFLKGRINAGRVERKGVELEVNLKPVVTEDFTWDFSFNWSKNQSIVKLVSPNTDLFTIYTNFVSQPTIIGAKEKEWGQIRGTGIKRIEGMPVIGNDGLYVPQDDTDFGTVLPNYNGGFYNSFSWKGLTLTASIDFQNGGKYFSFTDFNAKYSGLNKETAEINDRGVNVREPLSANGGLHVYGVTNEGKAYDTYVSAYDYFRQFSNNNIWDYSIFDASYMKLREVSVGYEIPVKALGNISKTFKRAYVSAVARNLWMIYTKNKNLDPTEIAANYAENGQLPGTRSVGLNIKFVF